MRKKDLTELRSKDSRSLQKLLLKKRLEFSKTKAETKVAREKNLKKAKNLKNDIAQILTLIRESEITSKNRVDEESKKLKEKDV